LEQERKEKMGELEIRSEKVERLRSELAILAPGALRFQLEKEILYEEAHIARLGERIAEIEQALQ
jgi:hypothetical protein